MKKKIAIVGDGIGGLALANCLQQRNIPYTLFEKAAKFGEVGAGIGLSESTFTILKKIGLGPEIQEKGRFVQDAVIVDSMARTIRKLPIKNGGFCIHRADLIEVLSKNIPASNVRLGIEIESFTTGEGSVRLSFKDQTTEEYDLVFACDGIHSVFRKQLYPNIRKRYSGQTIWRGIADCELPEKYRAAYLEFWGNNVRFGVIPLNDRQYYWYACKVADEGGKDDKAHLKSELKTLYSSYCREVGHIIESTGSHIIRNDMYDLKPHGEMWHKDGIVFLGDAIHATTPNLAQGGCQAIEDAYTVSMLISQKGISEDVFREYRRKRFPKVDYIVRQSWSFGQFSHQKTKFGDWMMRSIFKILPGRVFKNQYEKLIDLTYLEE